MTFCSVHIFQNLLDVGVVNNLVGLGGGGARDGAANQNEDNNAEAANEVEEDIGEEGAENGNNAAQGSLYVYLWSIEPP